MKYYLLSICLIITFTSNNGQTNPDLDDKITAIYPGPDGIDKINLTGIFVSPDVPNREYGGLDLSPGGGIPGTGTCDCIPYYLCNNGTPCTDGCGIIDIRISDDSPCPDYLTNCCEPEHVITKPTNPPPDVNKPKGCGVRNPDGVGFRIKGDMDNEAQFGEFPWMVAILREEGIEADSQKLLVYQCGGSIIHPQVILTSTHCVAAKKQYQVRAGEWDTQTKNELIPHQDRNVVEVITHPGYNSGALFNDIALLILDTELEIKENVDTICLPSQDELLEHTRCHASGWGKDVFEKEGKYQVILKKLEVPVIERELCQEQLRKTRLGKYFVLDKSFVCAGGEKGKDTCRGDGGSPLVCPIAGNSQRYFQGGIVAWGIGCGLENVPGVYANVALFRNWVDEQMITRGYGTSSYTY